MYLQFGNSWRVRFTIAVVASVSVAAFFAVGSGYLSPTLFWAWIAIAIIAVAEVLRRTKSKTEDRSGRP